MNLATVVVLLSSSKDNSQAVLINDTPIIIPSMLATEKRSAVRDIAAKMAETLSVGMVEVNVNCRLEQFDAAAITRVVQNYRSDMARLLAVQGGMVEFDNEEKNFYWVVNIGDLEEHSFESFATQIETLQDLQEFLAKL